MYMSDLLTIVGNVDMFGIEVPNLFGGFGENEKSMLVKTIAEIHGREVKHVNELINKNRARFQDGVHLIDLKNNELATVVLTDHSIMTGQAIKVSSSIYLLSQRGYVRLLKIMDDDTAWDKWDVIENDYFELKERSQQSPPMSQLQMIATMAQAAADQEQAIKQISATQVKQATELQGIRDVVTLCTTNWRKDTANLVNRMAEKLGGFEHIQSVRAESYKQLNTRIGVDVERRLLNKRKTMALNGVSESKRNKMNYLDVIGEDKKLLETYLAIIKEMSIKAGVSN